MDESGERVVRILRGEQNLPDAVNGRCIVDGFIFLVDRIIVQYRLG
jgi:hypothetical protein